MAKNPLFSTYRQGENRVTSSIMAVFERIDLSLLQTILAAASGESSLQMILFINQPQGKGHSVPDARISARFAYWFEVKTARNAVNGSQLREHLANIGEGGEERLFVVTSDAAQPVVITALRDPRVVWFNFRSLYDAIDSAVSDPSALITEQARFLLRELQAMLVEDGLVDNDDAVVVAARFAYPEYLEHGFYICQAGRAFRAGLTHMGFYAEAAIQPFVARIRYREDNVLFTLEEAAVRKIESDVDGLVGNAIEISLASGTREPEARYQVFVLSGAQDPDTIHLPQPIGNDTISASGKIWAWTIGQRYTSVVNLMKPGVTVTSDLAKTT
jgi:hypothetical protein